MSVKSLLLWEKWRPKNIDEVILLPRIRKQFENGISQHCILYGHYGTGKTSLIRFLLGEIESVESVFKLDGNSVSVFDLSALMGSLSQQHFVFKGSVQQNVGLKQSFSAKEQENIDKALKKASFRIDGVENLKDQELLP